MSAHFVDGAISTIWVIFWLYWLVAGFGAKKTRSRSGSSLPIRVVIIVVAFALIRGRLFNGHGGAVTNVWLYGVGFLLFLAGLTIAVWARVYLGRNWGMPMSQREDPELVTTGPYRYVRHPIYSGILLGMIGTAVAVNAYWFIVVVLVGGYFIYSAVVEERNMEQLFPDTYPKYKRSTKMLVPFVF